jgi:hypothetical protein
MFTMQMNGVPSKLIGLTPTGVHILRALSGQSFDVSYTCGLTPMPVTRRFMSTMTKAMSLTALRITN